MILERKKSPCDDHYKYDCLNPIIDQQFTNFNDRFNEVNSELLTYVAAFNPKNSFDAFKFESSMELANAYPSDLIQMSQAILVLSFIFT